MSQDYNINSLQSLRKIMTNDSRRLSESIKTTKTQTTLDVLETVIDSRNIDLSRLADNLNYDHKALLLITDPEIISHWLFTEGLREGTVVPSVNVAKRLEKRYGVPCPVAIWRTCIDSPVGHRQIELFLPSPESEKWNVEIVTKEQNTENEAHTAFTVKVNANYTNIVVDFLKIGLSLDGEMTINKVENSSTQYFINPQNAKRVELINYNLD
jgi:hypothetical protein